LTTAIATAGNGNPATLFSGASQTSQGEPSRRVRSDACDVSPLPRALQRCRRKSVESDLRQRCVPGGRVCRSPRGNPHGQTFQVDLSGKPRCRWNARLFRATCT